MLKNLFPKHTSKYMQEDKHKAICCRTIMTAKDCKPPECPPIRTKVTYPGCREGGGMTLREELFPKTQKHNNLTVHP